MRNYIFCLFIIAFISCKRGDDKIYIPQEKFIAILTDIHLADAYYSAHYLERRTHNDSLNFYNKIYKSYGYTKAQFDTTLKFYSIHSEKFDKVYEEVITRLGKLEQENYKNRTGTESSDNLWYGKNSWYLPEEGSQLKVPVYLKLRGKGKYTISFTSKVYFNDESRNLHLNLYFTDSLGKKKDTLQTITYLKDARTTINSITKELKDSSLTHLKGFLLDHNAKRGKWKKHVIIEGLKVYYQPVK